MQIEQRCRVTRVANPVHLVASHCQEMIEGLRKRQDCIRFIQVRREESAMLWPAPTQNIPGIRMLRRHATLSTAY